MASIKCKCGNTYFARVMINQFMDYPAGLHAPLQEVEPDHDIRLYQCISCHKYMIPPMHYQNMSEDDRELYGVIADAIEGKITEKKPKHKSKTIHSGTARFIERTPPAGTEGTFIKAE